MNIEERKEKLRRFASFLQPDYDQEVEERFRLLQSTRATKKKEDRKYGEDARCLQGAEWTSLKSGAVLNRAFLHDRNAFLRRVESSILL